MLRRAVLMIALFTSGCEKCAPGEVASGASRLAVRTFGGVVELVNSDEVCGFQSPAVLAAPQILRGVNGAGAVSWIVDGCTIDYSRDPKVSEDCAGTITEVRGRVTVSAIRTVRGTLTGDPATPVVPDGPDAVTVELTSAVLENFSMKSSSSDAVLTVYRGALTGLAAPRVARSASSGVCRIPTRHAGFYDVALTASAHITTADHDFDVDVDSSLISAVHGKLSDQENLISGTMSVWGSQENISGSLLPNYDFDDFTEAFACRNDLALPVQFECATFAEQLSQGAARITVLGFGTALRIADSDPTCGFAASPFSADGELGADGGSVTWAIGPNACTISGPRLVSEDCVGKKTFAGGTISVRGTKTVRGFITGDPAQPVVPTSRDPAEVRIAIDFTDFSVWTDPPGPKLTVRSGTLTGTARPRMALDRDSGACSISTPNVELSDLKWSKAAIVVETDGRRFEGELSDSNIDALAGTKELVTNYLGGTITIFGTEYPIADHQLQPNFDPTKFEEAYRCNPKLVPAVSEDDCSMRKRLGEGVARLMVKSLGGISKLTNNDNSCGFKAMRVLLFPTGEGGQADGPGYLEHHVSECTPAHPADEDCLGRRRTFGGDVTVSARRHVEGTRTRELFVINSIIPGSHEAVTIDFESIVPHRFAVWDLEPGASAPDRRLELDGGTISAEVHPVTGESVEMPGRFDVPTPIAHMARITARDVGATLLSGGKTFRLNVDSADLEAFNGSYGARTNAIRGRIVVDGVPVDIALAQLDPGFEQSEFDRRYACTADLASPVPSASGPNPGL